MFTSRAKLKHSKLLVGPPQYENGGLSPAALVSMAAQIDPGHDDLN
jgi:hypothetical protein